MGKERLAPALQLLTQLDVVVDLAIVDNLVAPGFVRHGLVSSRAQVNDAQAQMAQSQVLVKEKPAVIRAAVSDGFRHTPHGAFFHALLGIKVINAADAAHRGNYRLILEAVRRLFNAPSL